MALSAGTRHPLICTCTRLFHLIEIEVKKEDLPKDLASPIKANHTTVIKKLVNLKW